MGRLLGPSPLGVSLPRWLLDPWTGRSDLFSTGCQGGVGGGGRRSYTTHSAKMKAP